MSTSKSLNDDPLWASAAKICQYGYRLIAELPEEEKWDMVSKLRQHSFNLTDSLANGIGSLDPRDGIHYFGTARRHLHGLKNVLTMAKRLYGVVIEPQIMLDIENLILSSAENAETARRDIPAYLKILDAETGEVKKP